MKEVFDKTPKKIQKLWDYIAELQGKIDTINKELVSLTESNNNLWEEINKPKTVKKKNYDIDISKCYFVERDSEGNIATDVNGNEKIGMLYNSDNTKTMIVWDKDAQCFRFYAVYAPGL